jgi:hypothetical protein
MLLLKHIKIYGVYAKPVKTTIPVDNKEPVIPLNEKIIDASKLPTYDTLYCLARK